MTRTRRDLHLRKNCMRAQASLKNLTPHFPKKRPQLSYIK